MWAGLGQLFPSCGGHHSEDTSGFSEGLWANGRARGGAGREFVVLQICLHLSNALES